jgi:hypothetical protein
MLHCSREWSGVGVSDTGSKSALVELRKRIGRTAAVPSRDNKRGERSVKWAERYG